MKTQVAEKTKSLNFARNLTAVTADKNGTLPTRIEILRAGNWVDSIKGTLVISTADLQEMKTNFDSGLGQAGDGLGVPIDFMHESWGPAAGWIKGLVVEGDALYAEPVEWSKAGQEALLNGEFKCFSPTFYPACLGEWMDSEDYTLTARNVLEGGALTNVPFFKDLTPIMASKSSDKEGGRKNVIFISASEKKEKEMPILEEVRAKDASALTEEEKTFLVENKANLTAEEQAKFGFEVAETVEAKAEREAAEQKAADEKAAADAEAAKVVPTNAVPVAASAVKGNEGNVVMAASEVKAMSETINSLNQFKTDFEKKEATTFVEAHAKRGAIKADQIETWTNLVMADTKAKDLLTNLPSNEVMANEYGSDNAAGAVSATGEVRKKAAEAVKASREAGKEITIGEAMSQVMHAEPTLATRYEQEIAEN